MRDLRWSDAGHVCAVVPGPAGLGTGIICGFAVDDLVSLSASVLVL